MITSVIRLRGYRNVSTSKKGIIKLGINLIYIFFINESDDCDEY